MRRPARMVGGRVLRAVGRVVGTGADAVSAASGSWTSKPARSASVSTVTTSPPAPSSSFATTSPTGDQSQSSQANSAWFHGELDAVWDDYGWEKEERLLFGPPPTKEEAEEAVAKIQQIIAPLSYSQMKEDQQTSSSSNVVIDDMSSSTEVMIESQGLDWIEPSRSLLNSRALQSSNENVFDALELLQINPTIQRMVISLSSDKAVWDAVMNSGVVEEIKRSFSKVGSASSEKIDETEDNAAGLFSLILENILAKISELVEKIDRVVKGLFHLQPNHRKSKSFDAAVRTSFMLSVIVFVVIAVARLRRV